MKKITTLCLFIALSHVSTVVSKTKEENWPRLTGLYLGQQTPGNTPQVFAPGLISTDNYFELNSVFSSDQKAFMFSRTINGNYKMFLSYVDENGYWTSPQMTNVSEANESYAEADMVFSHDERWLYFISDRPLYGYPKGQYEIWRSSIEKNKKGYIFGPPEPLGENINTEHNDLYPHIVGDGSLYFSSSQEKNFGKGDIYRSQYRNGEFDTPLNLGSAINSENYEGDIYVSPDESYLIHVSSGRTDGFGKSDLYISFKQEDGSWRKSVNMGKAFNSPDTDYCPMVTPDGKYFFFSRNGTIMWVSTNSFEQLK
ncbi:PD40 domain-containing protein [Alteromonas sp. KUL106]|uniref:PD40 domain-containing protein n=1 Tax=Alteromonas sp. KUL106 TaxID=2480799 RepID=UPI0012E5C73F|nr:PD40 domain-containing protein [Alteromonas sp. KUL106]GFD68668.1 hypothetical protein KUL106_19310 [Alteromonas sp. KUL106]